MPEPTVLRLARAGTAPLASRESELDYDDVLRTLKKPYSVMYFANVGTQYRYKITPADEALARVACWYVAMQGETK